MKKYTTEAIPYGYCHCGCGQLAPLHKVNGHCLKHEIGTPRKFIQGHATRLRPKNNPVTRFWETVNKNGSIPEHCPELGNCWEWTGSCFVCGGYGSFHIGNGSIRAHRFSWELNNDKIQNGLWVLHKCDNPKCVNPTHLFLGTPKENTRDMINKNRSARGEKGGMHKITNEQAEYIRERYAQGGITQLELGRQMGIDQAQISRIVNRKSF